MPISQDRMLKLIEVSEALIAWSERLRSVVSDISSEISDANAALDLAAGVSGREERLSVALEALKAKLTLANAIALEDPLSLELFGIFAIERNHFRKTYKRNEKAAVAVRRVRERAGAAGTPQANSTSMRGLSASLSGAVGEADEALRKQWLELGAGAPPPSDGKDII